MRIRVPPGVALILSVLGGISAPAFAQVGDTPETATDRVVQLAAGAGHTCALRASGTVSCWGLNLHGAVGDGSTVARTVPVPVAGVDDAVEITTGCGHTCVRLSSGAVACWGLNASGQLGDGSATDRLTPVAVRGLTDATRIVAGCQHTCALRPDRTLVCWGYNEFGILGDGTERDRRAPAVVHGLSDVTDVAAGMSHTCALRANGTVACWGSNDVGQLGDGTTTSRTAPVDVLDVTDALEVAAGCPRADAVTSGGHTCVRHASGEVSCWGDTLSYRIGYDGPVETRHVTRPVRIEGLTDAVQLSARWEYRCALRATGSIACARTDVDVGVQTQTISYTAVALAIDAAGFVQFTLGQDHGCAIGADGGVVCWGANQDGRLGDGTGMPADAERRRLPDALTAQEVEDRRMIEPHLSRRVVGFPGSERASPRAEAPTDRTSPGGTDESDTATDAPPHVPPGDGGGGELPDTPSRTDLASAMAGVSGAVRACGTGEHGTATVAITVAGSTGHVTGASVSGQFAGTPVGSCIAAAVRAATFPHFSRSSFTVNYPFRI